MQEYPREVRAPPLPLAALVGAPPLHTRLTDALHEGAVNACGQRRLKYLSFDYDVRIPPCKRGAKDQPGYRIVGILKKRWLQKVCNEVPSVLVLCFDWSEEPRIPQSEEAQALQRLQHARRQARERQLRLLVFAMLPAGTADTETACGFLRQQPEGGSLVVAGGAADLPAKAAKLERLVYQSSMAFYAEEEKRQRRVWAPKPQGVPITAHNAMQVRVNFKVGFLSELRKDARGALRSYIKAYELLIHDAEVATVVERMALCNHITFRMYQLYLQSMDVSAAVHHWRVHSATLRACNASEEVLAWRKWHWLAGNHALFAELLESRAQQMPLLLDQADMWQFPGFHYQCAATYAERLKKWACAVEANGTLPLPLLQGGDLVEAPFVGQAELLDRPHECADPMREAGLRQAHHKAAEVRKSDRCLQLLTRALAACKERGYAARAAVCDAWIAEEYLSEGNLAASTMLYERLRRGGQGQFEPESSLGAAWPAWPPLRRLALERSILCGCRELGLPEPSLCSSSRVAPEPARQAPDAASAEAEGEEGRGARLQAARQGLLRDLFEYFGLAAQPGSAALAFSDAWRAELETLVSTLRARIADADSGGEREPVQVALEGVTGEVDFGSSGAEGNVTVNLRSSLAVDLEASGVTASTTHGDIVLRLATPSGDGPEESGAAAIRLQAGKPLALQGAWPQHEEEEGARLLALRLDWASCPAVRFTVSSLALPQGDKAPPLLPPPRVPGLGQPARSGGRSAPSGGTAASGASAGVARPLAPAAQLRAELLTPVDPGAALASEPFVFYVVVFAKPPAEGAAARPGRLWLACAASVQQELDERGAGELQAMLLRRPGADGLGESEEAAGPIPLPASGSSGAAGFQAVANLAEDGQLSAEGPALAFAAEQLARWPCQPREGEHLLAIPVAVRCGRSCRALAAVRLQLRPEGGGAAATVATFAVQIHFRAALLPAFEERPAGGPQRALAAPRRFSLRAATSVPVELHSVEAVFGDKATPAIGGLGRVAPGALHALALLPAEAPPEQADGGMLTATFSRAGAGAAFCPWAGEEEEDQLRLDLLPPAQADWPLPSEAPTAPPAASAPGGAAAPPLRVELEHAPTGGVAEPLEVRVLVKRPSPGAVQELRVQLLQGEGGQGSDKFFVCGPTNTQVIAFSSAEPEPQFCCGFSLVPLKSGSLSMPRVQVSCGAAEAASSPSSVFIFPRAQPVAWRSVA